MRAKAVTPIASRQRRPPVHDPPPRMDFPRSHKRKHDAFPFPFGAGIVHELSPTGCRVFTDFSDDRQPPRRFFAAKRLILRPVPFGRPNSRPCPWLMPPNLPFFEQ